VARCTGKCCILPRTFSPGIVNEFRSDHQPAKTAIYFGVDGGDQNFKDDDDRLAEGEKLIETYFAAVSEKIRAAGFEVGVYGSGLSCRRLRDELGYVKYCWLSMSAGHPESKDYESKKVEGKSVWDSKQCKDKDSVGRDRELAGIGYDPDILNPDKKEFGFWSPR